MRMPFLVVLDTNVVLDLFMFREPSVAPIEQALRLGAVVCVSDAGCLEELRRVLAYPQFRLDQATAEQIMREYLSLSRIHCMTERMEAQLSSLPACRDPDDQKFLRLAYAAHVRLLVTKDKALLALARKKTLGNFAIVSTAHAAQLCSTVLQATPDD